MSERLEAQWLLGEPVHIDGDTSIKGYVTAIMFRETEASTYEVQWLHNGDNRTAWLVGWRLSAAT
jgi:ribosome modulation factor